MTRVERDPTCECGHGPDVHTRRGPCRLRQQGQRNGVSWRGCGCEIWRPVPREVPPCECTTCRVAPLQLLRAELAVRALAHLVQALLVPAPPPVTAVDIPQQRGSSDLPARTRSGRS